MNRGRLAYPQWNQYKLQDKSASKAPQSAPALGSENFATKNATVHSIALNESKAGQETTQRFTYTISPGVAEAAKIVAEASPQPLPDSHGVDIAKFLSKHRRQTNDTNRPPQKYVQPNGLDGYVYAAVNSTLPAEDQPSNLAKRASTGFWLTTMRQRGSSPYAPSGYKVRVSPYKDQAIV